MATPRKSYRYVEGHGLVEIPLRKRTPAPNIIADSFEPYRSIIDDTWISSRTEQRAHDARNQVMGIGNERVPTHSEQAQDNAITHQDVKNANDFLESLTTGARENYLERIEHNLPKQLAPTHRRETIVVRGG